MLNAYLEWLRSRMPPTEQGEKQWADFMHHLHTPPPAAWNDPRVRALAARSYRRSAAAAEPE